MFKLPLTTFFQATAIAITSLSQPWKETNGEELQYRAVIKGVFVSNTRGTQTWQPFWHDVVLSDTSMYTYVQFGWTWGELLAYAKTLDVVIPC